MIPTEKGPSSLDTYNIINYAVSGNIHITWWSIIIITSHSIYNYFIFVLVFFDVPRVSVCMIQPLNTAISDTALE